MDGLAGKSGMTGYGWFSKQVYAWVIYTSVQCNKEYQENLNFLRVFCLKIEINTFSEEFQQNRESYSRRLLRLWS